MDAEVAANLERAEQSLAAARILLEEGYFDDACSRADYSTYHASTAALLATRWAAAGTEACGYDGKARDRVRMPSEPR